jgi:hypothetical protein
VETKALHELPVISLSQVRNLAELAKQEESISRYLGILSFSQLINETANTIENLSQKDITKQIAVKSQLVFKELGSRIEGQSTQKFPVLSNMRKQIDQKIQDIQHYL